MTLTIKSNESGRYVPIKSFLLYLEQLRTIFFTLEKFRQIKRRGPQVRDMPRHELVVIKLLIIATEPVKTIV